MTIASIREGDNTWPAYAAGIVVASLLMYLLLVGQGTLLTTILLLASIGVILVRSKTAAINVSMAFVILLGDIRRIRDLVFPHPNLDIFLLVTPLVALVLALPLLLRLQLRDKLSKAIFWLLVIMVLEIFNPAQGGITVGLSGALFIVVPILWFWIGRQYGSPKVVRNFLYKVFMPLTLAAGVLGLYQNFVGFLPWEQVWIDANKSTFVILNLGGGNSRSFGFSVSPAEYATLLAMGAAAAVAVWFTHRKVWSLAFPVMVTAMVLAGGRGVVVKLICTIALLFALRKGKGRVNAGTLIRLVILTIVGLVGVSVLASRFAPASDSPVEKTTAQAALAHQSEGLANPLDSHKSTAGLHAQMVLFGIIEGFRNPIGYGLGAASGAGLKFGVSNIFTEVDISDMFVSLGFIGGSLYLYCVFLTCQYCFRYVRKVPFDVSLPTLAIIISGIGVWLVGGQYSTCAIWMFLIGSVAREEHLAPLKGKEVVQVVRPAGDPHLAFKSSY